MRVDIRFSFALVLVLFSCIGGSFLAGCGASGDGVLAKIGDYSLTVPEYERQYLKNNGGQAAVDSSTDVGLRDFLHLLVKYRLKVLEAKSFGYDKDPEILKELNEYRNSLAVPYLTERALIDKKIEKLYQRRLEEVRASHILIRAIADSTGKQDTAAAYAKARDVLRRAMQGERFDSLATRNSDDPGTAKNGGDLLYFTAGMTLPVFDDAVYSLKPGEIYPEPIKTVFGYHIVKLTERKKARGEIEVSHILARFPESNPKDTASAYAKIVSVRDSLRRGIDFKELAMRNSEDPSSANNGGDLGWVGRRRFVPEFEMAAFSMKVGETSDIVRTNFGYHIIRITGERPVKSFDDSRQELKEIYRRYGYDEDNAQFVKSIDQKYNIAINQQTIEAMAAELDTTQTSGLAGWSAKLSEGVLHKSLLQSAAITLTVDDAVKAIERNRDMQSKPLTRAGLNEIASVLRQKEAMQRETADLEKRYPEFDELMQEYREGVLLFKAEQDAVWNKVVVKEDALKSYWEEHRADYRWPDRVQFSEIFVSSDSLAKLLRDSINAGVDFGELAARQTQRSGYKEKKGDWGLQAQSANDLAKQAFLMQPGWVEGPIAFQYGHSLIKMTGKEAAREKTFEEAQSEVSSKYQESESKRLEREWIDSLKKKFNVSVDEQALKNAFRGVRKKS
jgi:peptidyl-prolyl cis-trans isomerase SurA